MKCPSVAATCSSRLCLEHPRNIADTPLTGASQFMALDVCGEGKQDQTALANSAGTRSKHALRYVA